MPKAFIGKVVSVSMQKTVVVEITRQKPHPLYRKLLKRSHRFKADPGEQTIVLGDLVKMTETRPMGQGKHFKVTQVLKKQATKKEKKQ